MTGFRRTSRSTHVVHAIHFPELERSRRPTLRRRDAWGRYADPERRAPADAEGAAPPAERAPVGPAARRLPTNGGSRSHFRVVRARPEDDDAGAQSAIVTPAVDAPMKFVDTSRVELLERRLAKLARLLEERDLKKRVRSDEPGVEADADAGVASRYSEVQGLRGESEEVDRKRALMATLFEANRKLRERVGSDRAIAE